MDVDDDGAPALQRGQGTRRRHTTASPYQREVGGGYERAQKPVEAGRRRELPACTVQTIYKNAARFISQITLKFVW